MSVYVETSAAVKLLVEEAESAALAAHLDGLAERGVELVSSVLLETELRRLAIRQDLGQVEVTELLARLRLVEPDRAVFTQAGLLPGANLRSLDALHIAVALRVEAEAVLAYGIRQSEAARAAGLTVLAPGRGDAT